jgi:hypothetical protein
MRCCLFGIGGSNTKSLSFVVELIFTFWLFNIAMENGPFTFTDDFPLKSPFIMEFP